MQLACLDFTAEMRKDFFKSYLTVQELVPKTASRIIIELQDKVDSLLPTFNLEPQIANPSVGEEEISAELKDALAALKALGYTERDVKRARKELVKESSLTTDQYIRRGLSFLN